MTDVDLAALDTAASELGKIGDALQAVDVAGPFAPIAQALPGTQTAEAAVWVSTRMGAAVQVVGDHVHAMATSARKSAAAYRETDAAAGKRLSGLRGGR